MLIRFLVGAAVGFGACLLFGQGYVYPVGNQAVRPSTSALNPNGYKISQGFNNDAGHTGVDLANGAEGGDVRAIGPGVVTLKADEANSHGWGNVVVIRHDIMGGSFYSLYAHMQTGSVLVSQGDIIQQAGAVIGRVDCTGHTRGNPNCPSNGGHGAHLHFGVKLVNALGCGYITKNSCKSGDTFSNYVPDPIQFVADHIKGNVPTAGFLIASGNLSAIEGQTLNLIVPAGATAQVSFSASRSVTYTGNIVGWNWTLDGIKTSSDFSFTTNLPKGSHSVTLVVTTDSGSLSSPATGTIIVTESTPQALWPVSGHDSQRTGLANYVGPGEVPKGRAPRWSYSTSAAIVGDIVVSAEGTLYIASDKLYALTPSGTSYAPPVTFDRGVPLSSPAIDDTNGFVYVVVSSPNPTNNPNLRAYDVIQLSKQLTNQTTVYHSPYPYSNPNIVPHGLMIGTDRTAYFTDGATVVARGGHSWTTGMPNTGPCFGSPGFLTPTLGSDGSVFVPCQGYGGNSYGAGLYKFDTATGTQLKYTPYPYMRVEFMFDAQNRLRAGDSSSFGVNSTGHYDAWDTNLALISDVQSDDTSSRSSLMPDGSSTVRIGKSTLVDPTNTFYYDPNYQGAQTNTLSARGAHSWDIRGGTSGSTSFFSTVPSVDSAGNIFVGTVAGVESRSGVDGSLIWSFATGDTVTTQPVIAGPGVLYVGTSTGKIYAF